jgi:hypothetical protein
MIRIWSTEFRQGALELVNPSAPGFFAKAKMGSV